MKKKTPGEIRSRSFIILGIGIAIALLGLHMHENTVLCITGVLVMYASLIHHFICYRCPHCGKYLGRITGPFCPGCGRRIDEE